MPNIQLKITRHIEIEPTEKDKKFTGYPDVGIIRYGDY